MYCTSSISSNGWNVCGLSWFRRLKRNFKINSSKAVYLKRSIESIGLQIKYSKYFDTITILCDSKKIKELAALKMINFCLLSKNEISISVNEKTNLKDLKEIISVFEEYTNKASTIKEFPTDIELINERKSNILSHPVFNSYHTETSLMRYIKSLENKDLSLTQSMISLGSCTMKLNSASEMIPLSWTEWNSIHPFVPVDQAKGYHEVINRLEEYLS